MTKERVFYLVVDSLAALTIFAIGWCLAMLPFYFIFDW